MSWSCQLLFKSPTCMIVILKKNLILYSIFVYLQHWRWLYVSQKVYANFNNLDITFGFILSLYIYIYNKQYYILYIHYIHISGLFISLHRWHIIFSESALISQLCLQFFEKLWCYTLGNKDYSKNYFVVQ